MPRGGARPGAGRKKGSKGQHPKTKEAREVVRRILKDQTSPLEFMLVIMHNNKERLTELGMAEASFEPAARFEAAKAAAPFVHPKLSSVAITPQELDYSRYTDEQLDQLQALLAIGTPGHEQPAGRGDADLDQDRDGAKPPAGDAPTGRKRRNNRRK